MTEPRDVHVMRLTQADVTSGTAALIERFETLCDEGRTRVAVDMSQLSWASSISVGVLLRGMKRMREAGGDLRLFALQALWTSIIEICELTETFRIFETETEAIDSFEE